jgi:hypothetical protein
MFSFIAVYGYLVFWSPETAGASPCNLDFTILQAQERSQPKPFRALPIDDEQNKVKWARSHRSSAMA